MKVLLTTDVYAPVVNGVVTSTLNLKAGLEARGHEVCVLTLAQEAKATIRDGVTRLASLRADFVYPHTRVQTDPARRALRELVDWHPDAVHSQCEFFTFPAARKIAAACGVPLIHTYHTVYEDYTHYFCPNVRLGKRLVSRFTHHIASETQALIAPTEKVTRMLRQYGVSVPVYTVPSGIDLNRFSGRLDETGRSLLRQRCGLSAQDTVFVFVGRLGKEKKVEELFALLTGCRDKSSKLLLVGDGPYRETLERIAREQGLLPRIRFTGMIPPERVADYYRLGDVFVSASQSETQGLTYIEAMASGLPVLCRRDPCLEGVVRHGENGFLFDSPDDFCACADRLAENGRLREQCGALAKEDAARLFSVDGFAAAVENVYCEAAGSAMPANAPRHGRLSHE